MVPPSQLQMKKNSNEAILRSGSETRRSPQHDPVVLGYSAAQSSKDFAKMPTAVVAVSQ